MDSGVVRKGRGRSVSWGHPEGKGEGGRGWGFYSEEPSPCRASSWAERFEASLWDFLLVALHLVRGLGGKYGAQALKTVPGPRVHWWQLTKPPCLSAPLPPPPPAPSSCHRSPGWQGRES